MYPNLTNTSFIINRDALGFKDAFEGLALSPHVQMEQELGDVLYFTFFNNPESLPFFALAWIINLPQLHIPVNNRTFEHPALTTLAYLGDSTHYYSKMTNDEICYHFFTLSGAPTVYLKAPDGNDYIFSYSQACPEGELTFSDPNIIKDGKYLDPKEFFDKLQPQNNLYPLLDSWAKIVLG